MWLRANLFQIETRLLCWCLVFGFAFFGSIDLSDDVLAARPSFMFVAEQQDKDDLKEVQFKFHPTAFVRWSKDGGEVSESVALPRPVDHERHAVVPQYQYDVLLVFRV